MAISPSSPPGVQQEHPSKHWWRSKAIGGRSRTAKNEFGLDHNESRSWHGWHRHVSLVMLAFAMMAAIRRRAKLRQAELAKQFEATTIGVRAARAERLNRLRRPAFLLSGLLTCGCCGGKYGIVVNDRYGCLGHFRKGICDNVLTIRRGDIERRVLAGLTDKLVSPEAVAVAVRAYAVETNRENHERRAQAETSRRALEKTERGMKGIMDAIEDGMYQPAMKARMEELVQQKAEIEARLADAPADLPDVHPNIAEHYRAKVIRLAETLAEPGSNGEAREDIRSLVGEVVITPATSGAR